MKRANIIFYIISHFVDSCLKCLTHVYFYRKPVSAETSWPLQPAVQIQINESFIFCFIYSKKIKAKREARWIFYLFSYSSPIPRPLNLIPSLLLLHLVLNILRNNRYPGSFLLRTPLFQTPFPPSVSNCHHFMISVKVHQMPSLW